MSCPFSLENVKFRETAHIAFEDEYVTAYQSTDIVPKIYKSVNTPRDKNGLASGKPKTYYRTRYSEWVTEKTFITQYQKIREKFEVMLIIEILKIIASLSITIALFYTFFKVGRLSAYDRLLEHFNDAVKLISKQEVIIQTYEQKLKEIEKEAQQ